MTILAFFSKREVYSNFKIKIDRYKPLEVIDLLELKDNIDVYIDEGYTWLESRTSGSTLNRYLSYIILQSRKRTIDIVISAQMFRTIDVRFRDQADLIVKCERTKKGFKYSFYFLAQDRIKVVILPEKKAKKFYALYDTYQIIEPHKKEQMRLKLLEEDNPKELWNEIENITDKIKGDLKEITHPRVLNALLKNGFKGSYEPQVYVLLKDLEN